MKTMRIPMVALLVAAAFAADVATQPPSPDRAVKDMLSVDAAVVALVDVRVIDGTGAPPREHQTVVLRDGLIAAVGEAERVSPPTDAAVITASGKSVLPGLVMLHEHLYYPTGPGVYAQLGQSFVRLYLAGGVTTMRTGGNMNGFMDLNLKRRIDEGTLPGPAIDATAPYLNGPNPFLQMQALSDADDARRQVAYWADAGATSFKAYMQITRAELGAAIEEAHRRGLKVTGHLCSVTYAEAADLGIDNLEHGFLASTDFVSDKQPDVCPGQTRGQQTIADLDPGSEPFRALVGKLVSKGVALTSTPTVFETFTPARPMPPGLEVLLQPLRERFDAVYGRVSKDQDSRYRALLPKMMALEYAFARAGGLLVVGTDPTGAGGVVPGFANQRALELLVEAGFTPLEAIRIGTLHGAKYLGREASIGTIAAGKQADLVVVGGDPSRDISHVRQVEIVFRRGQGFDPKKLVASVSGQVGLW